MGFTLHFINTLKRPLEYRFKKFAIDGVETALGNAGEVIAPATATRFRTATVSTSLDIQHSPEQFLLEMEYVYGEPGILTRHVQKRIVISIFHGAKSTDYGYELDEEK